MSLSANKHILISLPIVLHIFNYCNISITQAAIVLKKKKKLVSFFYDDWTDILNHIFLSDK